ncbi:MAG: tetratricopeptide repeat protein [Fusobacteriota bacterium]
MRKKFFLFAFIFMISLLYSDNIEQYKVFSDGKSFYVKKEYNKAKKIFENFEANFSDSDLSKKGLATFYLGKIHFKQGDYVKSLNYLKSSNYRSPEYYLTLAKVYKKLGQNKDAISILKKSYENSDNEKKQILYELSDLDHSFFITYKAMYDNDFNDFWELNFEELIKIGTFHLEKNNFDISSKFFDHARSREKLSSTNLGKYFFARKDFKKAIDSFKVNKSKESLLYLVKSYEKINNLNSAKYYATELIKSYPQTDLAAYYRLYLYEVENNDDYLKYITLYNKPSNEYYGKALYLLEKKGKADLSEEKEKYSKLITKLEKLLELDLSTGISLEIKDSLVKEEDPKFETYLRYKYLEKNTREQL